MRTPLTWNTDEDGEYFAFLYDGDNSIARVLDGPDGFVVAIETWEGIFFDSNETFETEVEARLAVEYDALTTNARKAA